MKKRGKMESTKKEVFAIFPLCVVSGKCVDELVVLMGGSRRSSFRKHVCRRFFWTPASTRFSDGRSRSGVLVFNRSCNPERVTVKEHLCSPDVQLSTVSNRDVS